MTKLILLIILIFLFRFLFSKFFSNQNLANILNKSLQNQIEKKRQLMAYYVISIIAKIAKADGVISQKEADFVKILLDNSASNPKEREFLKSTFNKSKENIDDVFILAQEFAQNMGIWRFNTINIMIVFTQCAYIDHISPKKLDMLYQIANILGIDKYTYDDILKQFNARSNGFSTQTNAKNPYEVLGLSNKASFEEVKKAYKTLAKRYHPDILNTQNISQEELKKGITKFHEINEAYEQIKKMQ